MGFRKGFDSIVRVTALMLWLAGCGSDSDSTSSDSDTDGNAGSGTAGAIAANDTTSDDSSDSSDSGSTSEGTSSAADDSESASSGAGTADDDEEDGSGETDDGEESAAPTTPQTIDELEAQLDDSVSWTDLTVVYDTMYTAFIPGSDIQFKVPANIQDVSGETVATELSGWSVLPEGALTFDADTETGGVIATVAAYYPEVLIAYTDGFGAGGTASLYVTEATEAQWQDGEARYNNENELVLPFLEMVPPFGTPEFEEWRMEQEMRMQSLDDVEFEGNYECTNCHTTGAKYFEIQHTPTQAARYSDEELLAILSEGKKPEGVGFRLLPDELAGMSAQELYSQFHAWTGTDEELSGIVVYLRSLTPEGQGDIRLPNGEYVSPDADFSDMTQ